MCDDNVGFDKAGMKRNSTKTQIKDSCLDVILTFAFSRTKATTFVGRGWALVNGYRLHKALTTWNFAVNLIRQIPQETGTVLHQLQEELKMTI